MLGMTVSLWPKPVVAAGCPPSPFRTAKPLVIAHASSTYFGPANTITMMRAAVKAGADVVDVDVRVSADGVLVASHDDDLRAQTGKPGSLRKMTLTQLRKLDIGSSWPGPHGDHPLRGKGITISTVEEILNAFPTRRVSLEFKTIGGERSMCTLLRRLHRTSDVYIGSAGDTPVDRFKPMCPEVVTTVTDAMVIEMQRAHTTGGAWCSSSPIGQPPFTVGKRAVVTRESVDWDHRHGMAVYTWTLDDPKQLAMAAEAGVDGVYTGRADVARAVFDHR